MEASQVHPFLALFCKELTYHLESVSARQKNIDPGEFTELVAEATREVLDAYVNGEFDLQQYSMSMKDGYREIAINGLESYAHTNDVVNEISEKQAILLHSPEKLGLIDFNSISERMCDLQSHLNDEVKRANEIIQHLSKQVQDLELTTTLDPLTKAYNRHALQLHFGDILSKNILTHDMFILMIDIDNFKMINDRYGHVAGDKVLIFVSKLFKKTLRDGDRLYRFGGEEFVILLNRTDIEGATLVANRLLTLCRQNKPLFQNEQIIVTLSMGLTQIKDDDSIDSVIHRSDLALYRAKHSGKDQLQVEL